MPNPSVAKARSILQTHWDGALPVHIGNLVKALGIAANPVEMENAATCARLTQDQAGRPVILYNVAENVIRKRFAVAHALGHYVLGHNAPPPETRAMFTAAVADPAEQDANSFAGAILVPHAALAVLANSGKFRSLAELAKAFAVSQALLAQRMRDDFPHYFRP